MSTPGSPVSRSVTTTGARNGAAVGAVARAAPPASVAAVTAAANPASARRSLAIPRSSSAEVGFPLRGERVARLVDPVDLWREAVDPHAFTVDLDRDAA